jgi:hypothetical protein
MESSTFAGISVTIGTIGSFSSLGAHLADVWTILLACKAYLTYSNFSIPYMSVN